MTQKKVAAKGDRKDADKPELAEKTVTVQGIKVTIDPSFMGTLEVQELLDDITSKRNPFAIASVFKIAFGDQYEDVKKKLREKHSPLTVAHMEKFMESALKKANPNL